MNLRKSKSNSKISKKKKEMILINKSKKLRKRKIKKIELRKFMIYQPN